LDLEIPQEVVADSDVTGTFCKRRKELTTQLLSLLIFKDKPLIYSLVKVGDVVTVNTKVYLKMTTIDGRYESYP
jgi:hypothetical protein